MQALKEYKRVTIVADDRRPISMELLCSLCKVTPVVGFSDFKSLLIETEFVLAFYGTFRISEL